MLERRAGRRRTKHPAVQHAFELKIVDETRSAKNLVGKIEPRHRCADDMLRSYRLRRDLPCRFALEQLIVDELPIACSPGVGGNDVTVDDAKRLARAAAALK